MCIHKVTKTYYITKISHYHLQQSRCYLTYVNLMGHDGGPMGLQMLWLAKIRPWFFNIMFRWKAYTCKTNYSNIYTYIFVIHVELRQTWVSWLSFWFYWFYIYIYIFHFALKICESKCMFLIDNYHPNMFRVGDLHIEAETKWTPFCIRHFQVHFLEWECLNYD